MKHRHVSTAVVAVAASASLALAVAPPALADRAGPGPGARVFGFSGTPEDLTVPEGVCALSVTAYGAAGGAGRYGEPGGRGTRVSGVLPVAAGQTLTVDVGGKGRDGRDGHDADRRGGGTDMSRARGGHGGGGRGGALVAHGQDAAAASAGGGGRTVVSSGVAPLVVAGGGDGAGRAGGAGAERGDGHGAGATGVTVTRGVRAGDGRAVLRWDPCTTGGITAVKTDADDGKSLPGVVLQVWRETNGRHGLQRAGADPDARSGPACTTDRRGRCDFADLPLGTYHLQEVAAPHGYGLPRRPVTGPLALETAGQLLDTRSTGAPLDSGGDRTLSARKGSGDR